MIYIYIYTYRILCTLMCQNAAIDIEPMFSPKELPDATVLKRFDVVWYKEPCAVFASQAATWRMKHFSIAWPQISWGQTTRKRRVWDRLSLRPLAANKTARGIPMFVRIFPCFVCHCKVWKVKEKETTRTGLRPWKRKWCSTPKNCLLWQSSNTCKVK